MGPVESNPDRYAGAWRLLIWAPLLVLAVASRFVLPSSWAGLVTLWGWAPLLVGLAAVWAVVGFLGVREWRHHTDRLESIPIRIHVDGSRGKTGTCRLIGAALRANGLRVVVKTTGKMPVLIDADREPAGTEGNRAIGEGAARASDRDRVHGRRSRTPPCLPGNPDPGHPSRDHEHSAGSPGSHRTGPRDRCPDPERRDSEGRDGHHRGTAIASDPARRSGETPRQPHRGLS